MTALKALVFAGTGDGSALALALARQGWEVTVSVASDYGATFQERHPNITVVEGRKDEAAMASLLTGMDVCVDATHPYAVQATQTIRAACLRAHVPYRRMARPSSPIPHDAHVVRSATEAAALVATLEGRVLLTTGTKSLAAFTSLGAERLFARVLPTVESIIACREAGLLPDHIIALHGPFSVNLNRALISEYDIHVVVTKESGPLGGFPEKAEATREESAELVVIQRPQENGWSAKEILDECRRWNQ